VTVRRLIWSLNDESGGIGWGAPEALAEIMARDERLADEYCRIFVSYLDEKGNFLEYEALQQGLLWGLARLAGVRPELVREAVPHLGRYLESGNAAVRGLAARAAGLLGAQEFGPRLRALLDDKADFPLYEEGTVVSRTVRDMAREALAALDRADRAVEAGRRGPTDR
jgi:HEAT repeat protein